MNTYHSFGSLDNSPESNNSSKSLPKALDKKKVISSTAAAVLAASMAGMSPKAKANETVLTPVGFAPEAQYVIGANGQIVDKNTGTAVTPTVEAGAYSNDIAIKVGANANQVYGGVGGYSPDTGVGASITGHYADQNGLAGYGINAAAGSNNVSAIAGYDRTYGQHDNSEYNLQHSQAGLRFGFGNAQQGFSGKVEAKAHHVDATVNGDHSSDTYGSIGAEGVYRAENGLYVKAGAEKNLGNNGYKAYGETGYNGNASRAGANVRLEHERYANGRKDNRVMVGLTYRFGGPNNTEEPNTQNFLANQYVQDVYNTRGVNLADNVARYTPVATIHAPANTINQPSTQTEKLDLSKLPTKVKASDPIEFNFDFPLPKGYSIESFDFSTSSFSLNGAITGSYKNGKIFILNGASTTGTFLKVSIKNDVTGKIDEHRMEIDFF